MGIITCNASEKHMARSKRRDGLARLDSVGCLLTHFCSTENANRGKGEQKKWVEGSKEESSCTQSHVADTLHKQSFREGCLVTHYLQWRPNKTKTASIDASFDTKVEVVKYVS